MAATQRLRKWHFLLLGGALILHSAYLWCWEWRILGLPAPLQPEHFIVIVSFVLGFVILGIFVLRLTRQQLVIMLAGLVAVNLLTALVSVGILRNYTAFFEWFRTAELADAAAPYIDRWKAAFLIPPLFALQAGLLLLFVENLIVFIVRKPSDNPE